MKRIKYLFLFIFVFQSYAQISDFKEINFKKADSIALECKDERLENLPQLAYKLTSNLTTDVERFRAIYKWVCQNIANDYALFLKNKRKRQRFKNDTLKLNNWNNQFRKVVFQKLIKDNKTLCTGYAYLVKKLSDLANIECKIIHGYARVSTTDVENLETPNHSWNAVKLCGKWYLCDPTWASGVPNFETQEFEFNYNNGFFLSNPKLFAVNHYPTDKEWLLFKDENHSFKTFIEAPVIYGKAYQKLSSHIEPKKMHNTVRKNENITFKFKLIEPVKATAINFLIDSGSGTKTIHPKLISIKNKFLTIEYKFKHTGFYDVHFLIGKDLISTYTFRVKN